MIWKCNNIVSAVKRLRRVQGEGAWARGDGRCNIISAVRQLSRVLVVGQGAGGRWGKGRGRGRRGREDWLGRNCNNVAQQHHLCGQAAR